MVSANNVTNRKAGYTGHVTVHFEDCAPSLRPSLRPRVANDVTTSRAIDKCHITVTFEAYVPSWRPSLRPRLAAVLRHRARQRAPSTAARLGFVLPCRVSGKLPDEIRATACSLQPASGAAKSCTRNLLSYIRDTLNTPVIRCCGCSTAAVVVMSFAGRASQTLFEASSWKVRNPLRRVLLLALLPALQVRSA